MSNMNGVHKYYDAIKGRLTDYLKSDYLANSETLLKYADELLGDKESDNTNIAREPYIETAASYAKRENGIKELQYIDAWVRDTLQKMAEANLGIFLTPFEHQVKALEAFSQGRDLFVSTGTGSGKTECFLWPIMAKSIEEARNHQDMFK